MKTKKIEAGLKKCDKAEAKVNIWRKRCHIENCLQLTMHFYDISCVCSKHMQTVFICIEFHLISVDFSCGASANEQKRPILFPKKKRSLLRKSNRQTSFSNLIGRFECVLTKQSMETMTCSENALYLSTFIIRTELEVVVTTDKRRKATACFHLFLSRN